MSFATIHRRGHHRWHSMALLLLLAVTTVLLLLLPFATADDVDNNTPTVLSEENVQTILDQAAAILQAPLPPMLDNDGTNNEEDDLQLLQQKMETLESTLLQDLQVQHAKVEELVAQQNVKQMQHFVNRLQEAYNKERALREYMQQQQQVGDGENDNEVAGVQVDNNDKQQPEIPLEDVVSLDMLQARLDISAIVQDSESTLMEWMRDILREELDAYQQRMLGPVVAGHAAAASDSSMTSSSLSNGACPSTQDVVQTVQQALTDYANHDGIGKYDHTQQQGAKVVHFMTSDTFSPDNDEEATWGDVWWRTYIPQDWENALLPPGWEDWTVKGLPSYLYHSVGFFNKQVAPPETILQKNTLPGACWPMEGNNGVVTLKLNHPVLVEEITIDHVSKTIIPTGWHNSAPKKIKIVGYPPCNDGDKDCESLGFDEKAKFDVAEFTYDMEGPSVQTFSSYYGQAMKDVAATTQTEQNEEQDGSCSTEAASCTTPPRIYAAGIGVEVNDNWGHAQFTCLYRVRIHGEAA